MTESDVRRDLAAIYRLIGNFGWDDLIFTHVSARVPGTEGQFLINRYGLLFDEITASSLVRIDTEGNLLDGEGPVNPAGFTIHSAIHAARYDAAFVIHLHTIDGTAVSSQREGLMPLNQTAMLVREDLAYHDYEGVALDLGERERLVADLGTTNMMILRNHGTLALGATAAEAFLRIYFLERACSMQARTLAGAVNIQEPSAASIRKAAMQSTEGMAITANRDVWPALRRRLEHVAPDFVN